MHAWQLLLLLRAAAALEFWGFSNLHVSPGAVRALATPGNALRMTGSHSFIFEAADEATADAWHRSHSDVVFSIGLSEVVFHTSGNPCAGLFACENAQASFWSGNAAGPSLGGASASDAHVFVIDTGFSYLKGGSEIAVDPLSKCFNSAGKSGVDCSTTPSWESGTSGNEYLHGTYSASNVAAKTYGIFPGVTLHVVKALDKDGNGYNADFVSAIDWIHSVLQQHLWTTVSVVSMSFAGDISAVGARALADTINLVASSSKVIFVAAAGNCDSPTTNCDASTLVPAAVQSVVAVADANLLNGAKAFNFGQNGYTKGSAIAIYAPGVNVPTVGPALWTGTSSSTPFVAGAFAFFAAKYKCLSVAQLKNVVLLGTKQTVANTPPGTSTALLNMYDSDAYASHLTCPPPSPPLPPQPPAPPPAPPPQLTFDANGLQLLAGNSSAPPALVDGTGALARFVSPLSVVANVQGEVYVADGASLRRVNLGGTVRTWHSASANITALENALTNVFVGTKCSVIMVTSTAMLVTLLNPNCSTLNGTTGVAAKGGTLFVADSGNKMIHTMSLAFTSDGATVTNVAKLASAQYPPTSVAVAPTANLVYFTASNMVYLINGSQPPAVLAGGTAAGFQNGVGSKALFNAPSDLTTDLDGNVYVADTGNNAVRRITAAGGVSTLATVPAPSGITLVNGNTLVITTASSRAVYALRATTSSAQGVNVPSAGSAASSPTLVIALSVTGGALAVAGVVVAVVCSCRHKRRQATVAAPARGGRRKRILL